jgi:hypothetical protein
MRKIRPLSLAVLCATAAWLLLASVTRVSTVRAANSPTFRDCSLIGGLDPDFVQLSAVTPGPSGVTVAPTAGAVTLQASESADPLDNLGHVTLTATVTSPGAPAQTASGAGTGKVTLTVPLASSSTGAVNTIAWKASFDNGVHACPGGGITPQNPSGNPFVVTVASSATPPPTPPALTHVRESHRVWRERGGRTAHAPIGTAFSFRLDKVSRVQLTFARAADRRKVGTLVTAGGVGAGRVRFSGKLPNGKVLKPGGYIVTVVAVGPGGLRSQPSELTFTIVR